MHEHGWGVVWRPCTGIPPLPNVHMMEENGMDSQWSIHFFCLKDILQNSQMHELILILYRPHYLSPADMPVLSSIVPSVTGVKVVSNYWLFGKCSFLSHIDMWIGQQWCWAAIIVLLIRYLSILISITIVFPAVIWKKL